MRRLILLFCAILLAVQPAMAAAGGLIRDAEIEDTLRRLSAPLMKAAGLAGKDVRILMLQDNSLNAFAADGRTIVLHTGLLTRLDKPEALAGVIAHELGHLTGGHHARRSLQARNLRGPAAIAVALGVAAAAAGGGAAGAAVAAGATSTLQRALLAYTRSEEASADQAAVNYMNAAGLDPTGMLEVLQTLKSQEVFRRDRLDPMQLSHPLSTERLSLLEARVAESRSKGAPTPPDLARRHARMRAKLDGFLGRPESVLAALGRAPDPESEPNRMRRAVALFRSGDLEGALAAVDALIAAAPRDAYLLDLKGQILFESARPAEAAAALRKAARLAPDEPLIAAALGRALLASGKDAEALPILERAARRDDAFPALFRDLSAAYGRAGREGEAALAAAERLALLGQPREAASLAHRAQSLLKRGEPGWLRAQDIIDLAAHARR